MMLPWSSGQDWSRPCQGPTTRRGLGSRPAARPSAESVAETTSAAARTCQSLRGDVSRGDDGHRLRACCRARSFLVFVCALCGGARVNWRER
eukprot:1836960-Rhodomonas_salina.1